jgi:hypothetical protein
MDMLKNFLIVFNVQTDTVLRSNARKMNFDVRIVFIIKQTDNNEKNEKRE